MKVNKEGKICGSLYLIFLKIFSQWLQYLPLNSRSFLKIGIEPLRFPQWLSGKESACNEGDTGDTSSIPETGRFTGGGHSIHSSIFAQRILWTEELSHRQVGYSP